MIPPIVVLSFFVMCLCSCTYTFQSKQLEFVKSLVSGAKDGPRPEWLLSSELGSEELYAVNVQTEVWFIGGENLVIKFDGWNIFHVEGLLAGRLLIEKQAEGLRFSQGDKSSVFYDCDVWRQDFSSRTGSKVHVQKCVASGQQTVENKIVVDSEGEITKLDFKFHPGYENLRIEKK